MRHQAIRDHCNLVNCTLLSSIFTKMGIIFIFSVTKSSAINSVWVKRRSCSGRARLYTQMLRHAVTQPTQTEKELLHWSDCICFNITHLRFTQIMANFFFVLLAYGMSYCASRIILALLWASWGKLGSSKRSQGLSELISRDLRPSSVIFSWEISAPLTEWNCSRRVCMKHLIFFRSHYGHLIVLEGLTEMIVAFSFRWSVTPYIPNRPSIF